MQFSKQLNVREWEALIEEADDADLDARTKLVAEIGEWIEDRLDWDDLEQVIRYACDDLRLPLYDAYHDYGDDASIVFEEAARGMSPREIAEMVMLFMDYVSDERAETPARVSAPVTAI